MLTDSIIRAQTGLGSTYTQGIKCYNTNQVISIKYNQDKNLFDAIVYETFNYPVKIWFNKKNEIEEYQCNCSAYFSYDCACKHIIAVLKTIQVKWNHFFSIKSGISLPHSTKELLEFFIKEQEETHEPPKLVKIKLSPALHYSIIDDTKDYWLEFSIGSDKPYIVKDIKELIDSIQRNTELCFGKNLVLVPSTAIFDPCSDALLELLKDTYLDEKQLFGWNYNSNYGSAFYLEKKFKLSNTNLLKFFKIMEDTTFDFVLNEIKTIGVRITKTRPTLSLEVMSNKSGLEAVLDTTQGFYIPLDKDFKYIYHNNCIYQVDQQFSTYIRPLLSCFNENKQAQITIPAREASRFLTNVVPALEKIADVSVDGKLSQNYYRVPLIKHVYFDRSGNGISARVVFLYGEISISPTDLYINNEIRIDEKTVLRDYALESKLLSTLTNYGFSVTASFYILSDEDRLYTFLNEGLPLLSEQAEIFYSNEFKNIKVSTSGNVKAGIKLNTESNLLEMSLSYETLNRSDLAELLASYRLKKKYHRLKNGSFISLESTRLHMAISLLDQLHLSHAELSKSVIELPKYRALYIDSLAQESNDFHIERCNAFNKMVLDIKSPQDMVFDVPEGISGVLRDYQKIGFNWLKTLSRYGLGGILADDMGLGKTLQVITYILSEKNDSHHLPSLVVVPTSLVYNWLEEVTKFAPTLSVVIISGSQSERYEQLQDIDLSDIVVTSYALLKRDISIYEKYQFKYCFIDEAQHIKNPGTQSAKSVKRIKANGYFALTGTPIENSLTELWSIFDFLMPGYLMSHHRFTKHFEKPIIRGEDPTALKELSAHIKPFILRRLKKDVLKELPEKIECKMTNEMTQEQKKIYAAYLAQAQKEFNTEVTAHGFGKSQIKILSILTRLRQICCHPSLFLENYRSGSGKLEMLLELLEEAVLGGHRVLVFSQFTSMLSIIRVELARLALNYQYLDGSTPSEDRLKLVNQFNDGDNEIFLISLKAGGTGLNLTGADMVIHYDPWWNPAVEDQATDRAHRIGQKKAVQVFKLITKDTIEEKIFALQQKEELIDTIIKPGENFLTKLSEQEVRNLFSIK